MTAKEHFENMSDGELIELVKELEKSSYSETSVVRKVISDIYGNDGIFILRINEMMWPLLQTVTERLHSLNSQHHKID